MCFSEFHKKSRGQLPPINLAESHHSQQNATKIAVDMVAADQSLSVDKVVNTMRKNNILLTFNAKKVDSKSNDAYETIEKKTQAKGSS